MQIYHRNFFRLTCRALDSPFVRENAAPQFGLDGVCRHRQERRNKKTQLTSKRGKTRVIREMVAQVV